MVVASRYIPERGDIAWITLDPHAGHKLSGRRPALVLSPSSYNGKVGLAVFCPITSQQKGFAFEVKLPGNLPVSGCVLSDAVKNLDWKVRRAEFCCRVSPAFLSDVLETLDTLLHNE